MQRTPYTLRAAQMHAWPRNRRRHGRRCWQGAPCTALLVLLLLLVIQIRSDCVLPPAWSLLFSLWACPARMHGTLWECLYRSSSAIGEERACVRMLVVVVHKGHARADLSPPTCAQAHECFLPPPRDYALQNGITVKQVTLNLKPKT